MDLRDILTLTVEDLRTNAEGAGLSSTGSKTDLQERLIRHFCNTGATDAEVGSNFGDATSDFGQAMAERSSFTLKDIEDSLTRFSGEGTPDIESWIQEFEDCSHVVKWNELQCYIYAKQLLTGAARIFVRSQAGVRDWGALKIILKKEFGTKLSSIAVHKMLKSRRKKADESYKQYLYTLMEISSSINLDEISIVEYFIEGIPDSRINKSILYQARNISELKEKIIVYEKIGAPAKSLNFKGSDPKFEKVVSNVKTEGKVKCFNCGEMGHLSKNCRSADIKCFKCKGVGHKSFECGKPKREKPKDEKVKEEETVVHTLTDDVASVSRRVFKDIEVLGKTVSALVDTGSDISLLRYDTLFKLSDATLESGTKILSGIGVKTITTMGCLKCLVQLDNVELDIEFYVVKEADILYSAVIGNDVLSQADLIIDSKGARFRRKFKLVNMFEASCSIYGSIDNAEDSSEEALVTSNECEPTLNVNPIVEAQNEFLEIIHSMSIDQPLCDSLELSHLSKEIRDKVEDAINSYKSFKPTKFPIEMKIVLKDDIPVASRPRRTSYVDHQKIDKQVREWLDEGIVKPSLSEYSSPVVLVSKKDGTARLCCDYRRLNEKIVRDNFPMAVVDDVVQRLQEGKVYTTIDLKNGFFHVPIEKESQKYTAFVTHNGQYEFCFVPFGISNSPAVFCRYISAVLQELVRDGTVIIYMDDIVIPSKDEEEGLVKLKKFLKVASSNGLEIKWSKCQFLRKNIKFLGYRIENSSIYPTDEKISAIRNFPIPANVKALQRFLGLTSFFRRFIREYALVAKPLSDLLRKNAKFKMGDEELLAVQQLKGALTSESVLRLYNPKAETEIHTDASMLGYGAVLFQRDSEDMQLHPVEYMSRKTSPAEEKYHSYELEVLAIVEALKKWRIYVMGLKFKIITDCNAFAMTMRKEDVPVRVSRWALFLQDFDYIIEHRSGTKMRHVDALSRVSCLMIQDTLQHRIKEAQKCDDRINAIRKVLEMSEYEDYFIKYDIVHKDIAKELIAIPENMEREIIEMAHRQGHFATKKTKDLVEKQFFIPKLDSKVDAVVKSCVECIITDSKAGKKEGLLNPIDKSDRPLLTYHLDHVGPMDNTKKLYNHILVIVDAFSKFVWLYPTKSTGSREVVDKLQKQAAIFGNPVRVITDRGTAFTSNEFEEYCKNEGIQHMLIATGVPRGNGQVERVHRVVVPMLAKMCAEQPNNWYRYIDRVQQILNNTPSRSTQNTPFKILTGIDMKTKEDFELQKIFEELAIEELQNERDQVREDARENILKIQTENKKSYDKKRVPAKQYNLGDLVAIKRTQYGTGLKLRPKFLGPYKVVAKLNHERYEVEKVGESEGSRRCPTVAEFMKPWNPTSGSKSASG